MRTSNSLVLAMLFALPLAAQEAVPVGAFRSLELHHGGHVVVRHGPVQRVTLLSGDQRHSRIETEGGKLVIANDRGSCPRGYRLEVEVVTPHLDAIAVSNGGTIEADGDFPSRESLAVAVEQGGTLDARAIPADAVAASVYSGGRVLTTARDALSASIRSGGSITYWGDPVVQKSIRNGGSLQRGH